MMDNIRVQSQSEPNIFGSLMIDTLNRTYHSASADIGQVSDMLVEIILPSEIESVMSETKQFLDMCPFGRVFVSKNVCTNGF